MRPNDVDEGILAPVRGSIARSAAVEHVSRAPERVKVCKRTGPGAASRGMRLKLIRLTMRSTGQSSPCGAWKSRYPARWPVNCPHPLSDAERWDFHVIDVTEHSDAPPVLEL